MDTLSRFQGCLVGLAVGDALGKAGESLSREDITRTYGGELRDFQKPTNYMYRLRPEQYTDDTLMAIIHAESIIASGKVDPEDIARRFVAWVDGGDTRGIGNTVAPAIANLKAGQSWQESGLKGEDKAGNGVAMRIAPLGLLHTRDVLTNPEALKRDVRHAGIITHNNREAIAGAIAVAYAVARLVSGDESLDVLIENTINFIGDCKVSDNLKVAAELLAADMPPAPALDQLGTGGYVVHTVASAFYCFIRSPEDIERTIIEAAMGSNHQKNDSDTTAAVAGAISGAYNGLDAIPPRWRDKVEDSARLRELATKLFELVEKGT